MGRVEGVWAETSQLQRIGWRRQRISKEDLGRQRNDLEIKLVLNRPKVNLFEFDHPPPSLLHKNSPEMMCSMWVKYSKSLPPFHTKREC